MKKNTFDLPDFLLGKLYAHMDEEDLRGWCLADAIALAQDVRKYDGIDCDPKEIFEIIREFTVQDENH